jgi:hypothetical protein
MKWEVSNEGLKYNCEELESGNFKWILVSQAVRTPKGFLIFTSPTVFHWFPIHAFKSDLDISKFNELVKEKVKKYKDKT